jgi:hypothetical protein
MQTNPNIILSGNQMAPVQLPDVNAMMQTRTAGLENIYNIEQQRAAQAQAAQKEQEAAALKALSPAIAAVFSDPSDAGLDAALGLVPAQFRDAAEAQLNQIRALPDVGRRKDLIRAGLVQDEAGRTLLAQLEPTAAQRMTADIQRGQLDVSRQRLAMEESQLGMPAPMSAADQARIELEERRVRIAEEEAAAKAAMPEGMDPKVKLKLDQAYPQATRALQSSVTSLDQDIQDVEKLLADDVGLKAVTGYLGAYTPNVFKDATRAQALLDKIMSGAGFSALQAMRDASPTGGALGNVSNQEGSKLEKSVAAFSQAQEYGDFRNALRQYLIDLKTAQGNVQSAFDETYSYRGDAPSAGIVEQTRARRQRIEEETATGGRSSLPPGVTVKRN